MGTSWLVTVPATTGTGGTAAGGGAACSNGSRWAAARAPPTARTAISRTVEITIFRRIHVPPASVQQELEDGPAVPDMPVAGQGVPKIDSGADGLGVRTSGGGLRPPTLSSVEPKGMPARPTADADPIPVG